MDTRFADLLGRSEPIPRIVVDEKAWYEAVIEAAKILAPKQRLAFFSALWKEISESPTKTE